MSPNAYLPMLSITLLTTTAAAIFLLFTGLFFGNLPVTVSLLPTMVLTRTSCLGQTIPIGGCKLLSEGSGPEFDTDLCQFLSMNCALVTHHFAHTLAQSGELAKQTVFLFIFSCIAKHLLHHLFLLFASNTRMPPRLPQRSRGEEEEATLLKISSLCPPVLSDSPESTGFLFLRLHPQLSTDSWGPGSLYAL